MPDTTLTLGCKKPFGPQRELLALARQAEGTTVLHGIAGRRGSKTYTGVLAMVESALGYNAGLPHLWTSPTYRDCLDTFFRTWQAVVPAALYKWRRSDMQIDLLNGSVIDVRSRQTDGGGYSAEIRGPTYAACVNDEVAKDRDALALLSILATLSHPRAVHRWMLNITTPRPGWYQQWVEESGAPVVRWSSRINPYLPENYIGQLEDQLDPMLARQEIDAEFVALAGRIWRWYDDAHEWPAGNRYHKGFDKARPWQLWADIGSAHSSWLVVQLVPPLDERGQRIAGYDVLINVVAEYQPPSAGVDQACGLLKKLYGTPCKVCIGADVNTRSSADLRTGSYFVRQHWGSGPVIVAATGDSADKRLQESRLNGLLLTTNGKRRLVVSRELRAVGDSQPGRGVREVFLQDAWPDARSRTHESEYLPKGGAAARLEHCRDALLYGAIAMDPPSAAWQPAHAA